METLHYASGDVGNQGFEPTAAAAGFNLADVGDAETLNSLPAGVKGLYYLDEAKGVTPDFTAKMNAIKGSPNLFAVYLADEPSPSDVSAADLKSESDWIHANMPGVKTFIVADNMGSNHEPNFNNYYTVDNTHIDLWGLDPYPIRSEMTTPDYTEIDRTILAAEKQIGVSAANIVPVFQAFGGVNDGDNGQWEMPTAEQAKAIFAEFAKFVPNPAFDYAYSWMKQGGDTPLSESPELQKAFLEHNLQTSGTPTLPVESTPPPATSTPTSPAASGSDSSSDPQVPNDDDATPGGKTDAQHSHHRGSTHRDGQPTEDHHSHSTGHDWAKYFSDPSFTAEDNFHFGAPIDHFANHATTQAAQMQQQVHVDGLLFV